MLAAAVRLAEHPLDLALPLAGEARSRACGSVVEVRLATDDCGGILRVGCRARACAVGQAAAAVFAGHAAGRTRSQIEGARSALAAWLAGRGPAPDWPEIALLEPARPFPARHGAILLAWQAALAAMDDPA